MRNVGFRGSAWFASSVASGLRVRPHILIGSMDTTADSCLSHGSQEGSQEEGPEPKLLSKDLSPGISPPTDIPY